MKLTKQQRKMHDIAVAVLNNPESFRDIMDQHQTPDGRSYYPDDWREFVYRNYRPDATNDIGKGSAFFTPWEIAGEFQIETLNWHSGMDRPLRIVDLCAGYGVLSLRRHMNSKYSDEPAPEITCIEINPEFVEVGKQLFPEAEWICADVFDAEQILAGREFDEFYSNPPFGRIPKVNGKKPYDCPRFEWAVAEIGMRLAPENGGTMILQTGATNWGITGRRGYEKIDNPDYEKWSKRTGINLGPNCGIDLSFVEFAATKTQVELVDVEFSEDHIPTTLF